MQHSGVALKQIVWQGRDVVVVGVERPKLMTTVKPVGNFSKEVVTYINVPDIFWQRFYNQPA